MKNIIFWLLALSSMSALLPKQLEAGETAIATFAGGCFWCMEKPFEKLAGVKQVISGYTGGHVANPTYEAVSAGTTGHSEVDIDRDTDVDTDVEL